MKINHSLLIPIAICLLAIPLAYFGGTTLTDSLAAYRSPLRAIPPGAGEPLGPPATRRLVWVLVDALRVDTAADPALMPEFNRLRSQGAHALMQSRPPAFSSPGWATLLTGAWPDINDSMPLSPDYETTPPWTQDHLFAAVRRTQRQTAVSGFWWFEKFLRTEDVSAGFYTPDEDHAADRAVVDAAFPWLDDPDYALVLIHLDQIDYAGHHEGGPRNPAWSAAAARADGLLGEIAGRLDLSRDTLLVCSDHGQIDAGGHGGDDPITMIEPFFLIGAGVRPGDYGEISMADVAPTVAMLLGTSLPASAQGRVLTEMVVLPPETLAHLPAATAGQQRALLESYAAAIGEPLSSAPAAGGETVPPYQAALAALRQTRLSRERVGRAALVLPVLLGLIGWLGLWLRGQKWGIVGAVGGALLALALFHLRYAGLDGQPYSFSAIKSTSDLIFYIATTTALTLGPVWGLSLGLRGSFRRAAGEAAAQTLALTLAMLVLLLLPIGANFIWNGFRVTWTLPELPVHFQALLAYIQALSVAGVGLILTGVAALLGRL